MLFSLIFLWGCGLELNSRMELNKDFSGHRLMTCTVSSADLARYFSGSKRFRQGHTGCLPESPCL